MEVNDTLTNLSELDDYLHTPTKLPDYRESYYFNWVDMNTGISGFSTLGILPNTKKREFVFALFYDDKREVYYLEQEGKVPRNFKKALSNDTMSYEILEPMKEWRIKYQGDVLTADITWKGRFPAYDFGRGSGTSWARHFEQSGIVSGTIQFADGRELEFSGLGERDKSWGSRDWHIQGWYALHAQFDDISIGLRRDIAKGDTVSSGCISTSEGHILIMKVDLETEYVEEPIKMPVGAITTVHGSDGSSYVLHSKMISSTSFVRFARDFPHGTTELFEKMAVHKCDQIEGTGTGLIEWLFTHPKK
jgi:hypothetical protein